MAPKAPLGKYRYVQRCGGSWGRTVGGRGWVRVLCVVGRVGGGKIGKKQIEKSQKLENQGITIEFWHQKQSITTKSLHQKHSITTKVLHQNQTNTGFHTYTNVEHTYV